MPDRMPLISGNWKMNHNHFEAIQLIQKLAYALSSDDYRHVDVSVHPPFTDIRSVQTVLQADDVPIALGAQNCHSEDRGAFTGEVAAAVRASGVTTGLCHVFVRHTSASLVIQENADPSARRDLEASFRLLAPENAPHYTHTAEGPDDMPSHVRAALTSTAETIPVAGGRLALGGGDCGHPLLQGDAT